MIESPYFSVQQKENSKGGINLELKGYDADTMAAVFKCIIYHNETPPAVAGGSGSG